MTPQILIDSNNFRQLLFRAVTLPSIILVLMVGVLFTEIMRLRNVVQWVDRTDQVIAEARKARQLVSDLEFDRRNYLLTDDTKYLTTADDQEALLNQELSYLEHLVADEPAQTARLKDIRAATTQLLEDSHHESDLRAQKGNYLDYIRQGQSAALLDLLDRQYDAFINAEDSQRIQREEAPRAMARVTVATAYSLVIILPLALLFSVRNQMRALSSNYEQARRLAEERTEALRKSEEWLSTTLRSIGDAVIATDRNERITFMNSVAESLTGWAQREVIGKDIDEAFHMVDVETRTRMHSPVAQVLAFGSTVGLGNYAVLVSRTGNEIVIDNRSTPIRDRHGNVHGAVLVFHDVTESQRAEQAMRESEARYRFLADAMPQIVWTAQPDGSVDYFNQRWFEYTGLTEEQSFADMGWTLALHPDAIRAVSEQWQEAIRAGREFVGEFLLRRASDDSYRWHLIRAVPIHDETGKVTKWFGACADIDDQKRAEEALRESEERFHKQLEAQLRQSQQWAGVGRLAESAAHDFSRLLTVILGCAELAKTRDRKAPPLRDDLQAIQQAGERAAVLTRRLLAFAHPPTDAPPLLSTAEEPLEESVVFAELANAPRGAETVLLAEEEEVLRRLMARILKTQGYQVLEAKDGEEALRLAAERKDGPIHLLASDVVLPQMRGSELASRLRALRPEIGVLFVSGDANDPAIRQTVQEAEAAFLPDPFTPAELAHKVREALDRAT